MNCANCPYYYYDSETMEHTGTMYILSGCSAWPICPYEDEHGSINEEATE